MIRILLLSCFFLSLVGCAAPSTVRVQVDAEAMAGEAAIQKQLAFDKQSEYSDRLNNISSVILRSAAPMCPEDQGKTMSIDAADKKMFGKDWETEANVKFGVGDQFVITWVSPTGGGAEAGLQVGDSILAVNGTDYGSAKNERDQFLNSLRAITETTSDFATVILDRSGEKRSVSVPLKQQCNFDVRLDPSDIVNAYADGKNIIITRGMMRFATKDEQLALVISHELGHNVMNHMDKKMTNYALGSILDIAAAAYGVNTQGLFGSAAAQTYSQDFEAEADYVSLYYLKAANLPVESVANFWREMAAEHPGSIKSNHAASHPATSERFLAIEKTVAEIRLKADSGQNLTPNFLPK